jgi:hypothetical protein
MAYRILLLLPSLTMGFHAYGESGAEPAPAAFKTLRYEEAYQAMKDPKNRHGLGDDIKYIALPFLTDAYLSLGGEWRERYQNLHGYEFGLAEFKDDDYLLQRVLLHGDLHLGKHFRAFVQLGSHYAFGKANEKSPVEEDHFDLQQGFAEFQFPRGSNALTIRGGRQEMSFGSERLVSVRNNPNIRRSFDAVRAGFKGGGFTVDAFYAAPLELKQGVLDDRDDGGQRFWGFIPYLAGRWSMPPIWIFTTLDWTGPMRFTRKALPTSIGIPSVLGYGASPEGGITISNSPTSSAVSARIRFRHGPRRRIRVTAGSMSLLNRGWA